MGYVRDALGKNEQVIIFSRKHVIVLLGPLFSSLFGFAIVFTVLIYAINYKPSLAIYALLLIGLPVLYFLYAILKWWNEEYYLTTHRIIQAEGIVNKKIIDSSLEKVNDIVFSQWWLERLLDFGDIEILTASDIGVNRLDNIKSPLKFKTAMLDQKQLIEERANKTQEAQINVSQEEILLKNLEELKNADLLSQEEFDKKRKQILAKF